MRTKIVFGGLTIALLVSTSAFAQVKDPGYLEYDGGSTLLTGTAFDGGVSAAGPRATLTGTGGSVLQVFQGITQYDAAALSRNFIPPDTMGAVGTTQFVEILNGAVAVYNKSNGSVASLQSDVAFWAAAGQTGTQGDPRILFNASLNRWVATAFGNSVSDIQIAVSNTADATGGWTSTKFTGYAGSGFGGGIADYATLAMDKNAIYIGTNDFGNASATATSASFQGTTLNVIPLSDVFHAGGPIATNNVQFFTAYTGGATDDFTRGFAIQGVNNSDRAGTTGRTLSVSFQANALTSYDITNAGTATTARGTATDFIAVSDYKVNSAARQPSGFNGLSSQIVDAGDDRVGSSVTEVNGRIYAVHTVTPIGGNYTVVRYSVVDAVTKTILSEGDIGTAGHDYYYGSIAVNAFGQVVISYDRSGAGADGAITVMARTFDTTATGGLTPTSAELTIKVSDVNDYHNGSAELVAPAGRQRFGDYSAITVDPTDPNKFWLVGEYATFWNNPAGGHPTGTGGSRWATVIAEIQADAVPEPATWAMMIVGFGMVGAAARRRRPATLTA